MRKFFSLIAAVLFAGSMMASTPLDVDFTAGQGSWTINDVELGGLSYVWQQNKSYGMKASAYNKAAYAAESWLISPAFSLAEATTATLTINHALNKGAATNLAVKASADGKTWSDLTLSAWPAGDSWTFEEATADLSAFAGESAVKIAFVYVSTTDLCPTWEVKTVNVEDDAEGSGGGEGSDVEIMINDYWYGEDYVSGTSENGAYGVQLVFAEALAAGSYTQEDLLIEDEEGVSSYVDWGDGEEDYAAVVTANINITALDEGFNFDATLVCENGVTYVVHFLGGGQFDDGEGGEGGEGDDLATKGVHTLTPALVTDEAEGAGSFSKVLDGIQIAWEGAFYNGTAKATNNDFRVYANKTMTITAGANIVKIEIAGLAKKDQEISVNHGNITVGGEKFAQETTKADIEDPLVVIESIDAKSLTISVTKQLQARIIRVTLEGSQGIEETLSEGKAVKVLHEGQLFIMKGDHTFTPMGQIVK